MKNKLLVVLAVMAMLVAFPFANTNVVYAADLTSVVDTPSSLVAGASSNHSVVFTTVTSTAVKSVDITFPSGFNISAAELGAYTSVNSEATPVLSTAGQVATVTFGTASAVATATYTIVINTITNTSTSGNATVTVETKDASSATIDGPTASAVFLIAPAAIANLTCEPSGQAGAVWLRWTVPVGTSAGYETKYQQGNTITYDSATSFTQTWSSGTVATAQQQLLTGLNPNTQYTFAAKALGANNSISAISSLTPICYAPGGVRVTADSTAPTTRITSPAFNSTVNAGEALVIKGTSLDAGGSSVQKIEVSLDGGKNWNLATVTENVDGNLIWQYTWANAQAGNVTIMARGTDWVGNVESPGTSITVTAVTTVTLQVGGPETAETAPTTGETVSIGLPYANPVGATQIQANITYMQQQLLALLQQLLALLQAQL